jgi:hypothetical protein
LIAPLLNPASSSCARVTTPCWSPAIHPSTWSADPDLGRISTKIRIGFRFAPRPTPQTEQVLAGDAALPVEQRTRILEFDLRQRRNK